LNSSVDIIIVIQAGKEIFILTTDELISKESKLSPFFKAQQVKKMPGYKAIPGFAGV